MVKRTCETRLKIHKILAPSNAGCDINQQDAKEDGLQKYHEEGVHLERFTAQGLTVWRESPPG